MYAEWRFLDWSFEPHSRFILQEVSFVKALSNLELVLDIATSGDRPHNSYHCSQYWWWLCLLISSTMVLYHQHNCRTYNYFTPKEKVQIAKRAGKLTLWPPTSSSVACSSSCKLISFSDSDPPGHIISDATSVGEENWVTYLQQNHS